MVTNQVSGEGRWQWVEGRFCEAQARALHRPSFHWSVSGKKAPLRVPQRGQKAGKCPSFSLLPVLHC